MDPHKHPAQPINNLDGKNLRIAIVHARWNKEYVSRMVSLARETLANKYGVKKILEIEVSGSYELPLGAQQVIDACNEEHTGIDAIICIGVLVKGGTHHFDVICNAVSEGLMSVQLSSRVPVIFGVLTCLNQSQIEPRVYLAEEWATAAVEAALCKSFVRSQLALQ